MMPLCPPARRLSSLVSAFSGDRKATAALEFAIVATPFIFLLLGILQVGVYYFAQAALDNGVLKTAQTLYTTFRTGSNPVMPSASALKASVATNAGGMINNDSTLSVEIRPMSSLSGATVPISDGVNNYGTTTSTLVVRAQATVVTFAPGFGSLAVASSSAIVRRQGY